MIGRTTVGEERPHPHAGPPTRVQVLDWGPPACCGQSLPSCWSSSCWKLLSSTRLLRRHSHSDWLQEDTLRRWESVGVATVEWPWGDLQYLPCCSKDTPRRPRWSSGGWTEELAATGGGRRRRRQRWTLDSTLDRTAALSRSSTSSSSNVHVGQSTGNKTLLWSLEKLRWSGKESSSYYWADLNYSSRPKEAMMNFSNSKIWQFSLRTFIFTHYHYCCKVLGEPDITISDPISCHKITAV